MDRITPVFFKRGAILFCIPSFDFSMHFSEGNTMIAQENKCNYRLY